MFTCGFRVQLLIGCFICQQFLLAAAEPAKEFPSIPASRLPAVLKVLSEGRAILIDIRADKERQKQSLQDSISMPLIELQKMAAKPETLKSYLAKHLPANKIVYVQSGKRGELASKLIAGYGYDAHALESNYDDLVRAGFKPAK